MNKLIIFNLFVLSSLTLHADILSSGDRQAVIQNQIIKKDIPELMTFNGRDFADNDTKLRAILAKKGSAEVNSKNGVLQLSNSVSQYKMSWQKEDFENGLDTRLNQVLYTKEDKNLGAPATLTVTSSTFDGKFLRSMTKCEGVQLKSSTDNEMYCATATKQICDKVLSVYYKNETLRTPKVSAEESRKILNEKVSACTDVMIGYSEVLKAFSPQYEGNASLKSAREELVGKEDKVIKDILGKMPDNSWKPTSINSLKGEGKIFGDSDYDKLAEKLSGSMRGMRQINDFVNMCADHRSEFGDGVDIRKAARRADSGANRQ